MRTHCFAPLVFALAGLSLQLQATPKNYDLDFESVESIYDKNYFSPRSGVFMRPLNRTDKTSPRSEISSVIDIIQPLPNDTLVVGRLFELYEKKYIQSFIRYETPVCDYLRFGRRPVFNVFKTYFQFPASCPIQNYDVDVENVESTLNPSHFSEQSGMFLRTLNTTDGQQRSELSAVMDIIKPLPNDTLLDVSLFELLGKRYIQSFVKYQILFCDYLRHEKRPIYSGLKTYYHFPPSCPVQAYQRPKSAIVQVAQIAAVTVVLVSLILGSFMFAAAYVQSNSVCQDAYNELEGRMNQLLEERAALGPQSQALVGDLQGDDQDADQQPLSASQHAKREEPRQDKESAKDSDKDDDDQENSVDPPIHLKLPLQLDFDELAGALMERNQRSRMNCVVEKRRAEEVVDHQPRTVRLPFGLNLTTDPRYEHVSGERMAIFCESGNDQRHVPMEQMAGPIVQQQQGPMPFSQQQLQQQMQRQHEQQMQQQHQQQMQQQLQQQIQMHLQQLHQHQMQRQHEQQMQQQQPPQHFQQQMPIQVLPMSHAEARGFQQNGIPLEFRGVPMQAALTVEVEGRDGPVEVEGRSLTPQQLHQLEQLHQLQQLQPQDGVLPIEVIEARAFQHPQDMQPREMQPQDMQPQQGPGAPMPADSLRPPYQRAPMAPIHAVPPQEEEPRPHYVQPRSVRSPRSVDALLHREKRVRRCACDCNC
ncbi:putative cyclin-dependent serine/threonine-protein kinase DDB_G0272797/DDB_G0274007 isoform X3 [Thrips palmi]|uniref:Cyclin-dependent serine/threonine-protein kinase DDB_G0272797/DDB_G0274007 isoform X3 n=1 Tax=Thrips palmi TaxID=161013 RepID=A0A6P9AED0_THRPL|nr:putative cyclin-dependent serine/threonine-protein kinase DDB_G0272797/DDB_G0274007 isoform X3 [Thrips palmi]